ncbi:glycoside hydrolase family 16 protein, partial [Streptomyces sp. XY332]|uniref:glycoside hydrolase family 16 protein n=1 Tax=Streptomyces sp. XY332 TaxID=1415561 RepID=UPI0006B21074
MRHTSGRKPSTVRRAVVAALSAMGVAAAAAAVVTLPANAAAPPPPAGWSQVFLDDFNGAAGSGVNTADWQYTTGTSYPGGPANFGTGEVETMTSSTANVSLDGTGNLRITPRRDAAGNWTSGRIETRRADFQPPAGGKLRTEARIQMPNVTGAAAKGYWPAFWMLGAPYRGNWWNWPGIGEIDIMENVQGINNVWATLHCGTSPGGPCNETSGIGGQRVCPGTSCQGGFHTYAVEWDRSTAVEEIRFSVDGNTFHTVRANQVDATTWANATNHGYFIILNVAMGGGFPDAFGGGPDAGTQPGFSMAVDYVSVLRPTGGSPPPTTPPTTPATPPPPAHRPAYTPTGAGPDADPARVAKERT